MKRLPVLAALLLLTGCGADSPPDPVQTTAAPEITTAASDPTEEPKTRGMRIGFYRMANIPYADAEALVSEILAQKKIEAPSAQSETYAEDLNAYVEIYEIDMLLTDYLGSDLGRTTLELHEYGWSFTNALKSYEAPEELRQKVCEKQFASVKESVLLDDGEFEDSSLVLEACGDVPEGAMWFVMQFDHAENLTKADVSLRDGSGAEIPVLIADTSPEYEGQMRELYAVTGRLLCQGRHTLTVGGVSAEFSVVPAQDFVAAEKVRIAKEKAEKQEQRKKENAS